MVMRHIASPVCAAVIALACVGCSASQTIDISDSGAGTVRMEIRLDPAFAAYLTDLNDALGSAGDAPLFDPQAIAAALQRWPGLALERAEPVEPHGLDLTISFDSVNALVDAMGESPTRFIRFEQTVDFARLAMDIDQDTLRAIMRLASVDPVVSDTFVPPDGSMSATEYRDSIGWALEEYATVRPLSDILRVARIETIVRPTGDIVQVSGGRRRDGAALFSTPLVDVASGERGYEYALVFTRGEALAE